MTLFGMICTDAYFAYRLEWTNRNYGDRTGILTYKEFLYRLAYQLIHMEGQEGPVLRRRGGNDEEQVDRPVSDICHTVIDVRVY